MKIEENNAKPTGNIEQYSGEHAVQIKSIYI